MKITEGIEMLVITDLIMGDETTIYPTLLWDDNSAVLVDAGYPGQAALLRTAVEESGLPWERLTTLVITHHDLDHIGGAPGLLRMNAHPLRILAHEIEKPYLEGILAPLKLAQLEATQDRLPAPMKMLYAQLKSGFEASRLRVDGALTDGEILPLLGGMQVILTPGHTHGHICLYHPASKTLISGDALCVKDGRLMLAVAFTNFDQDECRRSTGKLTAFDIRTIICYHGGLFTDDPNGHIAALARI